MMGWSKKAQNVGDMTMALTPATLYSGTPACVSRNGSAVMVKPTTKPKESKPPPTTQGAGIARARGGRIGWDEGAKAGRKCAPRRRRCGYLTRLIHHAASMASRHCASGWRAAARGATADAQRRPIAPISAQAARFQAD
jgi:hypothetical protein